VKKGRANQRACVTHDRGVRIEKSELWWETRKKKVANVKKPFCQCGKSEEAADLKKYLKML